MQTLEGNISSMLSRTNQPPAPIIPRSYSKAKAAGTYDDPYKSAGEFDVPQDRSLQALKFTTSGFNNFLLSCLNPFAGGAPTPSPELTNANVKSVDFSGDFVLPDDKDFLVLFFPYRSTVRPISIWVYAFDDTVTGSNRFLRFLDVEPSEIITEAYKYVRPTTGGIILTSNSTSTTSATLTGSISAATVMSLPALASMTFSNVTASARSENEKIIQAKLADGIVATSLPTGPFQFHSFPTNAIEKVDSPLSLLRDIPDIEGLTPGDIFKHTITPNSVGELPPNVFGGDVEVSFMLVNGIGAATFSATFSVTTVYYDEVLDQATGITWTETISPVSMPSGDTRFFKMRIRVPDEYPIERVSLATTANAINLDMTQIQYSIYNPSYGGMGELGPAIVSAVSNMGAGQRLSLRAIVNYDAVPDARLARELNSGFSMIQTDEDIQIAKLIYSQQVRLGISTVYVGSDFTRLLRYFRALASQSASRPIAADILLQAGGSFSKAMDWGGAAATRAYDWVDKNYPGGVQGMITNMGNALGAIGKGFLAGGSFRSDKNASSAPQTSFSSSSAPEPCSVHKKISHPKRAKQKEKATQTKVRLGTDEVQSKYPDVNASIVYINWAEANPSLVWVPPTPAPADVWEFWVEKYLAGDLWTWNSYVADVMVQNPTSKEENFKAGGSFRPARLQKAVKEERPLGTTTVYRFNAAGRFKPKALPSAPALEATPLGEALEESTVYNLAVAESFAANWNDPNQWNNGRDTVIAFFPAADGTTVEQGVVVSSEMKKLPQPGTVISLTEGNRVFHLHISFKVDKAREDEFRAVFSWLLTRIIQKPDRPYLTVYFNGTFGGDSWMAAAYWALSGLPDGVYISGVFSGSSGLSASISKSKTELMDTKANDAIQSGYPLFGAFEDELIFLHRPAIVSALSDEISLNRLYDCPSIRDLVIWKRKDFAMRTLLAENEVLKTRSYSVQQAAMPASSTSGYEAVWDKMVERFKAIRPQKTLTEEQRKTYEATKAHAEGFFTAKSFNSVANFLSNPVLAKAFKFQPVAVQQIQSAPGAKVKTELPAEMQLSNSRLVQIQKIVESWGAALPAVSSDEDVMRGIYGTIKAFKRRPSSEVARQIAGYVYKSQYGLKPTSDEINEMLANPASWRPTLTGGEAPVYVTGATETSFPAQTFSTSSEEVTKQPAAPAKPVFIPPPGFESLSKNKQKAARRAWEQQQKEGGTKEEEEEVVLEFGEIGKPY